MSLNETMTSLSNGFRNLYRSNDKYSITDMTKLLSSLEIHNLLDDNQHLDSAVDKSGWKALTGIDVDEWNKYLVGKKIVMSFDAEWSGFVSKTGSLNRLGFEFKTTTEDSMQHLNGAWLDVKTAAGKQRYSTSVDIYDKPIKSFDYANIYNQINSDATVKITNLKVFINPLGE